MSGYTPTGKEIEGLDGFDCRPGEPWTLEKLEEFRADLARISNLPGADIAQNQFKRALASVDQQIEAAKGALAVPPPTPAGP